eukprot:scaffold141184_cov19-Tisochrysis_lutea.AAC.1
MPVDLGLFLPSTTLAIVGHPCSLPATPMPVDLSLFPPFATLTGFILLAMTEACANISTPGILIRCMNPSPCCSSTASHLGA